MRQTAILVVLLGWALLGSAQKPNVTNAKLQQLSAASGLKPAFDSIVQKQESPAWIGYRFAAIPKERTICCVDSWDGFEAGPGKCCMGCRLESGKGDSFNGTVSDCSPPEPFHFAFVFFRVENKHVGKVRNYTPDCALDFGGLPLYWMEEVNPAQSVALLTDLALANTETDHKKGITNSAILAIAIHDDPAADQALEKLVQPGQPDSIRERVVFRLGEERGKKGLELLRKYAETDANEQLRGKTAFALTLNKEPGAIQDLISMARNDSSPRVRSRALFWMGQIGGRKEAEQITEAIANDPETEVKKRAVFALAQMKNGESVPLLINVAKTNKNPVVRKEAIRWLGMSNDPRALEYLEQLLTR